MAQVTRTELRRLALVGWLGIAGCGGDACIEELGCAPPEAPSFDTLYTELLAPSCALASRSCHGPGGGRTPSMVDVETARAELEPYVVPGQSQCSEVVRRVTSTEAGERMPPAAASRLASEDVCRLAAWIDALPE